MPETDATSNAVTGNDLWRSVLRGTDAGGAEYGTLMEEFRACLHALAGANLCADEAIELAADVARIRAQLEQLQVPEELQSFGRRFDLPGRGQLFAPVREVIERGGDWVHEVVALRRFYLGGAGFAHGGVVPLIFDEVMGELVKHSQGAAHANRTRYLNVEYLAVVPLDVPLDIRVRFARVEGRKYFMQGTLQDGDTVCARAECLFIQLQEGQP